MSLLAGCPRCAAPVARLDSGGWSCPEHGPTEPLLRPPYATYDAFAAHLVGSAGFPTYLPWPMSPGWSVTDFAAVGDEPGRTRATLTCSSGTSELDGPVDVVVVAEEVGVESQDVALWPVSTSALGGELDRSVVVGEAQGRWLWIVLRPASAVLLLRDDWMLRDVSSLGAPLLEVSYGGPTPLG